MAGSESPVVLGAALQGEMLKVRGAAEQEDAVTVAVVAQYPILASYQGVSRRALAGDVVGLHTTRD